jgi:hypothetical protein
LSKEFCLRAGPGPLDVGPGGAIVVPRGGPGRGVRWRKRV